MVRLIVVVAAFAFAYPCLDADAQGRGRSFKHNHGRGSWHGNGHGHGHARPSFGFSIGVGPSFGYSRFGYYDAYRFDIYGHDPYRSGRFKVPDLLDDPYFHAQQRYMDHYRASQRLQLATPQTAYPPQQLAYPPQQHTQPAFNTGNALDFETAIAESTRRLSHGLSQRHDSEAWLDYLSPLAISELVAAGKLTELRTLLTHYDGIAANPKLGEISAIPGFHETRALLKEFFGQRPTGR